MRDAAAADPAVRQPLHEDDQRRYLTQQALVDLVIGHLGWSPAGWRQWRTGVLDHQFFDPGEPARRTPRSGPSPQ
jgi:hypothetical protein